MGWNLVRLTLRIRRILRSRRPPRGRSRGYATGFRIGWLLRCVGAVAAGSEGEPGTDAVGHEGFAEPGGHGVLGPPAGAVRGNEDRGIEQGEVIEDPRDEGLEDRPVEVEPAEQCVQGLLAGEPPGVAADVDHAGVTAAADHDQPFAADVDDERLIVQHERVGLPDLIDPGLLDREARLVAADAWHLAGDQDGSVEQEAWLLVLDNVEAGLPQRGRAGGR